MCCVCVIVTEGHSFMSAVVTVWGYVGMFVVKDSGVLRLVVKYVVCL